MHKAIDAGPEANFIAVNIIVIMEGFLNTNFNPGVKTSEILCDYFAVSRANIAKFAFCYPRARKKPLHKL